MISGVVLIFGVPMIVAAALISPTALHTSSMACRSMRLSVFFCQSWDGGPS